MGQLKTDPLEKVTLRVTPEARRLLGSLTENGLFGTSPEDVAERLLMEKLREVVKEGWFGMVGYPDGRTQPVIRPG